MSRYHGHSLLLSLRVDHQENKFLSFGNELSALFCSNQRDSIRQWYLSYHVKLISQGKNKNMRSRLTHRMSLPQVWLA
jgi:hypothetical protein